MQKKTLFFILLFFSCIHGFTQKITNLTIILDKSINPNNLSCTYYDGKNNLIVSDTFINSSLRLRAKFYSDFASFHVTYRLSNSISYVNDFFINDRASKIILYIDPNEKYDILRYRGLISAIPIYDTTGNKFFKEMVRYRKKEARAVSELWEKHGNDIMLNDSLSLLNQKLFKSLNIQTLSFLKRHPKNYFAFWYFRTQIVETSINFLKSETAYLKGLVTSLNSVFPKNYAGSSEGLEMITRLNGIIDPILVDMLAPGFAIPDVKGNKIQLTDFKGKYILIDFWATWCAPCLNEIPFFKKIRSQFSDEKLIIIGVNKDKSIEVLNEAINKMDLNWIHLFDEGNKIQNLFGVVSFPTAILINNKGVVIYNSRVRDNKLELFDLLKKL